MVAVRRDQAGRDESSRGWAAPVALLDDTRAGFSVQQASRLTGLSEHNLRYYERVGLLDHIPRDPSSGHRRYSPANLTRCETLACLRAVGMSLDEMRRYFDGAARGLAAAPEQIAILEDQERVLEDRIAALHRTRQNLRLKADYWRARQAGDDQRATAISAEFSARIRAQALGELS